MDTTVLANLVVTGIVAVGIGIAGYVVSELLSRLVRAVASRYLDEAITNFIVSLARLGVLLLTLKLVVDQTGAAGVLVILITALTGAFAIGSERMASDFVSGINLFFLRYYRVGDIVTIGGNHGRVHGISLTHTSIANPERDKIIIPNSEALNQTIINHSGIPGTRLKARVPIIGPHDRAEAMRVMLEAAKTFEPQLRQPGDEPTVILDTVDAAADYYQVRVYAPEEFYGSGHALLLHIADALHAQGFQTRR